MMRLGTSTKPVKDIQAMFRPLESLEQRAAVSSLLGLGADNILYSFQSNAPQVQTRSVFVLGLQGSGEEQLAAIDYRPRTGQIYALGVENAGKTDNLRIYTISLSTGQAYQVGGVIQGVPASGSYGFDFNPTVDVLRIESDAGLNMRVNPTTGATIAIDTSVTPTTAKVVGSAYDRNIDARFGAAGTTLYTINATGNQLAIQGGLNSTPSPNAGVVTNVGPLGVGIKAGTGVGFDIPASGTAGGIGYASITDAASNQTGLYSVNLATGAATKVGNIGDGTTPLSGLTALPDSIAVVGTNPGEKSDIRVYNPANGETLFRAYPYGEYRGGTRVALADVNRDGRPDIITGAGPGAPGGHVMVYDGATGAVLRSFYAYGDNGGWAGGVLVAGGDVNGDGYKDVITLAENSVGGHIKVFSGKDNTLIGSFYSFGQYPGPISMATGDFNNDGIDEIAIAVGLNGQIKLYTGTGATPNVQGLPTYMMINNGVNRPLSISAGDVNGDGRADIVIAEQTGQGRVKVFSGANGSQILDFPAFENTYKGGARVALADANGDGRLDILAITAGLGLETQVRAYSGFDAAFIGSYVPYTGYAGGGSIGGTRG